MKVDSILKSWGIPSNLFGFRPVVPEELVGRFTVQEQTERRSVDVGPQKLALEKFRKDPFRRGSVLCLCSEHDGLTANLAAFSLLRQIAEEHGTIAMCKWHVVYGGYRDSYLDRVKENNEDLPEDKLVVFANVDMGDTPLKKERLRDLMEAKSGASVIVSAGGKSPIEFLRNLGRHATGIVWFPDKKTRAII